MLENAKQNGYENLISWMPDHKSFKIHVGNTNEKAMFVKLLKQYFNHNQYNSFLRQLQNYKFERICSGSQRGVCKHVLFMEGRPDLFHRKSIQDFQQQTNTTTTIISMGLNNLVQPADDDDDDGAGGSILLNNLVQPADDDDDDGAGGSILLKNLLQPADDDDDDGAGGSIFFNNLVQPADDDDDDDGAGGSTLISPPPASTPPPSMAAVTNPGTNTRNGLATASRSSSTNANL